MKLQVDEEREREVEVTWDHEEKSLESGMFLAARLGNNKEDR